MVPYELYCDSQNIGLNLALILHIFGFAYDCVYSYHFLLGSADLLNVFEVFLPQLLLYPNPSDPLNGDAASLMMKDRKQYDEKVKGIYFSQSNI